jgi:predicted peptidase
VIRWFPWHGPSLAVCLLAIPALLASSGCTKDQEEQAQIVQEEVYGKGPLNYLLFMPQATSAAENGRYPLILSLHGIGERGNDLRALKKDGLPKLLDGFGSFPFIVVSPQCAVSTEWYYDRTDTLVDQLLRIVVQRYPVDTMRIYMTGYSMGGIGAWDMAIRHPSWFAAVMPIAARREPGWNPCPMSGIPVWAFHGALDDVVPLAKGQDVVDAFRTCAGAATFTVYPDAGHDSWSRTYSTPEVFTWMLRQRRPP